MNHDTILTFANLENEIRNYGIAPPVPWPWAIKSNGSTDLALRINQLGEFLDDLKKRSPQEVAEIGKKTAEQWRKRNQERSIQNIMLRHAIQKST